ncbi:MAG: histidinol dehydrogenase, partial [Verrucomicrobiaceae bacterium]
MIEHLKSASNPSADSAASHQVRETVAAILAAVEMHGEQGLREYSERLDHWNPPSFRLSEDQVRASV